MTIVYKKCDYCGQEKYTTLVTVPSGWQRQLCDVCKENTQ